MAMGGHMFEMADANKDGRVSVQEATAAALQHFESADANRDGTVTRDEMERTFNMGIGMVAVVTAEDVDRALAVLTARHVPAWVVGEIAKQPNVEGAGEDDRVVLRGSHPRF